MHIVEIVPHRYWVNRTVTPHRTASFYGARPYGEGWEVATEGFIMRYSDNTFRVTFPTMDEAREWANNRNEQRRAQLRSHAEFYPETADRCAALIAEIPTF